MGISAIFKKFITGTSSEQKEVPRSNTFCMAPWIQLHAQTHGEVMPCCVSQYKGAPVFDLRKNPRLEEAWNSTEMKALRKRMLRGEKSKICEDCYEHETLGKYSDRLQYNRDYKEYSGRVDSTLPDGTVTEQSIPLLDIRFSNVCNYKCRICNSSNSSLLHTEDLKLGKISPAQPKIMKAANDESAFWDSFQRLLPDVKKLHFAGGEPFFIEEHYKTLEQFISKGRTDVVLSYNTNFSTLEFKGYNLVAMWRNFRRVEIWASLDDMGARGDYQRKGQQWEKVEENIRKLQQYCPHVLFGIDITVSIFNILYIPKYYRYLVESGLVNAGRVNLYFLRAPEYLCVTNLTPQLKRQAAESYNGFISECLDKAEERKKIKEQAAALIRFMQSAQTEKQREFAKRISEADELRNEKFSDIFPELSAMMELSQQARA